MKKTAILTALLLLSAVFTGCGATANANEVPEQEPAAAETEATQETESAAAEETEAEAEETEAAQEAEDMTFTVDITDVITTDGFTVIGNTATAESYSGIIELHLDDTLAEQAQDEIEVGKTYVFTVSPMMTMSIPPQVSVLSYTAATEEDIAALEEIRAEVSNFKDCMTSYETMSLEEIIQDANFSYATWTQEEITEFEAKQTKKGYTEDSEVKSYVTTRENLAGSVPGGTAVAE